MTLVLIVETHGYVARSHIDLLVDFLVLLENEILAVVKARLKRLQQLQHELLVVVVLPLDWLLFVELLLVELEVVLKHVDELVEQVVLIDFSLDADG